MTSRSLSKIACQPAEVISALTHWVELSIPCTRDAAESIPAYLANFDADLSDELRTTIGLAWRELLYNAVEWGGKLDPNRKVPLTSASEMSCCTESPIRDLVLVSKVCTMRHRSEYA